MRITHINNKAVAALVLLRGMEGSDKDVQAVYRLIQRRYGLPARELKPSRIEAIQAVMASDHFAYLMQIIDDDEWAQIEAAVQKKGR